MDLIKWNNAKHAIAECKTIDEVKDIRDRAEALRQYAKQAHESLEVQNDIAEIKLRAERRAGEMLKESDKAVNQWDAGDIMSPPKLKEIGIEKHESSRWQKIANIPEEAFEKEIIEVKESKKELTQAGMLKVAKTKEREENEKEYKERPIPDGLYQVVYADPPWKYNDTC